MRRRSLLLSLATLALLALEPPRSEACSCRDDEGLATPSVLVLPQRGERTRASGRIDPRGAARLPGPGTWNLEPGGTGWNPTAIEPLAFDPERG